MRVLPKRKPARSSCTISHRNSRNEIHQTWSINNWQELSSSSPTSFLIRIEDCDQEITWSVGVSIGTASIRSNKSEMNSWMLGDPNCSEDRGLANVISIIFRISPWLLSANPSESVPLFVS